MVPKFNRRGIVKSIGVSLAVGLAGCSSASSSPSGSTETTVDPTTIHTTKEESTTSTTALEDQLATVREATQQYAEPNAAVEAGFKPLGPYVPGMGWHMNHPQRAEQAAQQGFAIDTPNLLTYVETESGLQLGSVEWGVPEEAISETPNLFNDADADATEKWHTHEAATHVFALPDDSVTKPSDVPPKEWFNNENWSEFRPVDKDLSKGDTVSLNWGSLNGTEGERTERVADLVVNHPALTSLHAWVHLENPNGVFAPVNPDYTSGDGHSH